jgi:hypothetical protein
MKHLSSVAILALVAFGSACSIEQTKELNADCLQDRECVSGLVCLPNADNRTVCQRPYTGPLPMGTTDAGADARPDSAPADARADSSSSD